MSKKIRRRKYKNVFFDYEKEEAWLNEMSNKGLVLTSISNGYYHFEICKPGDYIYRIEFLKEGEDKAKYAEFMHEMNIDHIASCHRWQYFRRNSILGEFEIYTDIDSKIKHYQRINFLWYILSIIFIVPGFFAVTDILSSQFVEVDKSSLFINLPLLLIGLFFLTLALPLSKKINNLKKEQSV